MDKQLNVSIKIFLLNLVYFFQSTGGQFLNGPRIKISFYLFDATKRANITQICVIFHFWFNNTYQQTGRKLGETQRKEKGQYLKNILGFFFKDDGRVTKLWHVKRAKYFRVFFDILKILQNKNRHYSRRKFWIRGRPDVSLDSIFEVSNFLLTTKIFTNNFQKTRKLGKIFHLSFVDAYFVFISLASAPNHA